MENLGSLSKLGLEICKCFYSKKSIYQLETEQKIREMKNCALGGPAANAIGSASGSVLNNTLPSRIPFLSSVTGSLAEKLYNYPINKRHREKAKAVTSLLGAKSPGVDEQEFFKSLSTEFAKAVAEFLIAYEWQVLQISKHSEWKRNFQKLASVLTANIMNYMNDLSPEEQSKYKGSVDSTFFAKALIEGTTRGLKQRIGGAKEAATFLKLRAGRTLNMTDGDDWKTVGIILGPGIIVETHGQLVFYTNNVSNVDTYGFRRALPHEMVDDYLIEHGFEDVSLKDEKYSNDYKKCKSVQVKESLIQVLLEALNIVEEKDESPEVSTDGPIIFNWTGLVRTFTEREGLQTQIFTELCKPANLDHVISFTLVNIHGIGGNGKSQLAKKIFKISQELQLFDGNLIWINGEKEAEIHAQFKKLLDSRGQSASTTAAIKNSLYCQILKDQEFLMVLDNVVDFDMILNYLPTNGIHSSAKILITSKRPWEGGERGGVCNIPVGVFTQDEASSYVNQFTDEIKTEQLDEVCRETSRIPADLSLICHSFRFIMEECSSTYSWGEHLNNYGNILSTQDMPKDQLPGVEGLDYSISTKRNVACSMILMKSVGKNGSGSFAIFILKNFAFCSGREISRNEFAHNHPGFKSQAEQISGGSTVTKINFALSLLRRFGFTEELECDQDIMMSIHQSYQSALIQLIIDRFKPIMHHQHDENLSTTQGAKSSKYKIFSKVKNHNTSEEKTLLLGLIEWVQLDGIFNDSFLDQKFCHATSIWVHMNGDPVLVEASTKTRDMLISLCTTGNYNAIKLWEQYCKKDFIALLLDDTNEDKSVYYCSAVQRAAYRKEFSVLMYLVQMIAAKLKELDKKRNRSSSSQSTFKKLMGRIVKKEKKSHPTISIEYIHRQMLKVAYKVLDIFPAFDIISSNFPLLYYYEPMDTEGNRTLLHQVVLTQNVEAVKAVVDLRDRDENWERGRKFIDEQEENGWTALHYAVIKGLPNVVGLLLESGADAGLQDKDGNTPLHHAVQGALLEMSDVDMESWPGTEPEDIPKIYRRRKGLKTPLLQSVIEKYGEKLNQALDKFSDIIELILKKMSKTDVNLRNKFDMTALHIALGSFALVKLETIASLLEAGANSNDPGTSVQLTPLHFAMRQTPPSLELVRLLIHHGAHPSLEDKYGKKPFHWLESWRNSEDFIPTDKVDYEKIREALEKPDK